MYLNMRYSRDFFIKEYLQSVVLSQYHRRVKASSVDRMSLSGLSPRPRHPLTRPVHWSWTEQQVQQPEWKPVPRSLLLVLVWDGRQKRNTFTLQACEVRKTLIHSYAKTSHQSNPTETDGCLVQQQNVTVKKTHKCPHIQNKMHRSKVSQYIHSSFM